MTSSPYDRDLDRNPANYQPLTPITFLARAAAVFPKRIAIIHGAFAPHIWRFYGRSRQLASALRIQRVLNAAIQYSVMLANTPAMLEVHYGVP